MHPSGRRHLHGLRSPATLCPYVTRLDRQRPIGGRQLERLTERAARNAEVVRIVCCSGGAALSPSNECCESRASLPPELDDHWPILLLELLEPPEDGPVVELGVDSHLVQLAIYSPYLDQIEASAIARELGDPALYGRGWRRWIPPAKRNAIEREVCEPCGKSSDDADQNLAAHYPDRIDVLFLHDALQSVSGVGDEQIPLGAGPRRPGEPSVVVQVGEVLDEAVAVQ